MHIGIFDIETYHDLFCFCQMDWDAETKTLIKSHTITSDTDGIISKQVMQEIENCFENVDYIVSYNGTKFDLPVLAKMVSDIKRLGHTTTSYVYADGQALISYDRFNNPLVKKHCYVRSWSAKHFDLFNNCLLNKSLKQWEMYNGLRIQELPYDPATALTQDQCQQIAEYCMHDVECTSALFWKYGYDKSLPGKPTFTAYLELLKMWPSTLPFKFDRTPASLSAGIIYGTMNPIPPRTNQPLALFDITQFDVPLDLKLLIAYIAKTPDLTMDTTYRNIKYGKGGAHFAKFGVHRNVHGFDVASQYPTIIEHWQLLKSEYALHNWHDIKKRRIEIKHAGNNPSLNQAMKLILNSLSGAFRIRSSYSVAYDPAAGEAMCYIAQLIISELAFAAPDWSNVIEVNTDSVFVTGDENIAALRIKSKELLAKYDILLEEDVMPIVYFRDVNNYIVYNEDETVRFGKGLAYSDQEKKNSIRAVYSELFKNLIKPTLTLDWSKYDWQDFIFKYHKSAASKYATIGNVQMQHKNYYMMWTTRDCPDAKPISFSRDLINRKNGSIKARFGVFAFDIKQLQQYAKFIDYAQYMRDLDDELELWGREDLCTTRLSKLQCKGIKSLSDLTERLYNA